MDLQEIITTAKGSYPIGTKVKSLFTYSRIVEVTGYDHPTQILNEVWFYGKEENPLIYSNGKWAEIIEYPKTEYPIF